MTIDEVKEIKKPQDLKKAINQVIKSNKNNPIEMRFLTTRKELDKNMALLTLEEKRHLYLTINSDHSLNVTIKHDVYKL